MNGYFYVIKHISRKHFVSLQRYKIKKDVKPAFRNAESTKDENYEKNANEILCYSTKSNAIRQGVMEQCVKH